ncbi:MAG TPA: hypothetical protein VF587_18640, partial [Solirubrobacteraceae bacterium]
MFRERLAAAVAERRSSIVLGLDPDPARLWPEEALPPDGAKGAAPEGGDRAGAEADAPGSDADRVVRHCAALIAAAGPACVAVKPQLARFERLGAPGWAALHAVA